jgi:Ran GTPase-activating protein (RanGAP) involved in mRNA processing and transport
MGDAAASAMSQGLAHAPSLKEINMCGNSLTNRGFSSLLKNIFFKRSKIEVLNFSKNEIGLSGCEELSSYIADFKCRLRVLNVSHNNLHDAHVQALGVGIAINQTLRSLDLSYNNFGDLGIVRLCRLMLSFYLR